MNIYLHPDYLSEKIASAKRLRTIGTLFIVFTAILSFGTLFLPANLSFIILVGYPFLFVGFPLWIKGRSTLRRLDSMPHSDALLNAELKGLNNKYSLHHYVRLGDTRIDHLLITPSGLIVMDSNDASGPVTCHGTAKGDRWKSPTNLIDRMTGLKPAVGDPTRELTASVAAARELLDKMGKPQVPVKGFVLFTRNPTVQVDACSFQGVPVGEAKEETRALQQEMDDEREDQTDVKSILTSDDRRKLNTLLAPQSVTVPANPVVARR